MSPLRAVSSTTGGRYAGHRSETPWRERRCPTLSLFAPVFALAQGPVNLKHPRITSIANSNQSLRTASQYVMEQIRTERTGFQNLLTADATALLEIQTLEKKFADNRTKTKTAAVSFLSAEQKTKLKALDDASKLREEIGEATRLSLLVAPLSAIPQGTGHGFRGPR